MFTVNSNIVKDYVLLLINFERALDEVPEFQNLREIVSIALAQYEKPVQ